MYRPILTRLLLDHREVQAGEVVLKESAVPDSVKNTTFELDPEDIPSAPSGPEIMEGMTETSSHFQPKQKVEVVDENEGKLDVNKTENTNEIPSTKGAEKEGSAIEGKEGGKKEGKTESTADGKPVLRTGLSETRAGGLPRDYSQFPPEIAEALKNTPNKVFAAVEAYTKQLLEKEKKYAELEAKLPNMVEKTKLDEIGTPIDWYQHPDAFMLHPAFADAQAKHGRAQGELEHYTNQLSAIEGGADKWYELVSYDKRTGKPNFVEREVKPQDKAWLYNALSTLHTKASEYGNVVNQIANTFQNRYLSSVEKVNGLIKERFSFAADEKHPAHKHREALRAWIPAEFQGSPLRELSEYLYAALQQTLDYVEEIQKKQTQQTVVKQEQEKLEPSLNTQTAGGVGGKTVNTTNGVNKWGGRMNVPETLEVDDD